MKNVLLPADTGRHQWLMKVFEDIHTIRKIIKGIQQLNKSIGLVPTMGALHEGHISLIKAARQDNDFTIVTIFVNPIQFNNAKDFKNYPSSYEDDLATLDRLDCDLVFVPNESVMYPTPPVVNFFFGQLENTLEGNFRKGHFSGVALVVLKLFNIFHPTRAYFGQKDLQQFKIIEQLVIDASLAIELKMMPIVREKSGLALSSRNNRLTNSGRAVAGQINKALILASEAIKKGASINEALNLAQEHFKQYQEIKIEYLELVNLKDLQVVETPIGSDRLVLCFAGYVEKVRLIDNLII